MTITRPTLHVRVWGQGEPVILIHGSNSADPGLIWSKQRGLADRYRLVIPDRRGYGESPTVLHKDAEDDVQDIIELLGEGAHLVGLSYGAMIALLVAARRPALVKSLTLIEAPAFGIARGHPAVEQVIAKLSPVFASVDHLTPELFLRDFVRALGEELDEPIQISSQHRKAIKTTMIEPRLWDTDIPLDAIAATMFPKLVISGDWHPAFEAVSDVLATRLGARRAVIREAGYGVQSIGKPFNDRLESLMRSAVRV